MDCNGDHAERSVAVPYHCKSWRNWFPRGQDVVSSAAHCNLNILRSPVVFWLPMMHPIEWTRLCYLNRPAAGFGWQHGEASNIDPVILERTHGGGLAICMQKTSRFPKSYMYAGPCVYVYVCSSCLVHRGCSGSTKCVIYRGSRSRIRVNCREKMHEDTWT